MANLDLAFVNRISLVGEPEVMDARYIVTKRHADSDTDSDSDSNSSGSDSDTTTDTETTMTYTTDSDSDSDSEDIEQKVQRYTDAVQKRLGSDAPQRATLERAVLKILDPLEEETDSKDVEKGSSRGYTESWVADAIHGPATVEKRVRNKRHRRAAQRERHQNRTGMSDEKYESLSKGLGEVINTAGSE